MAPIKICIVDDEALFRKGMGYIISDFDGMELIGEYPDGEDFLNGIKAGDPLPDVVLMDMKMERLNGMETTKLLLNDHPDVKVLVLSLYFSEAFVIHMIETGASGYLPKNSDPEEVRMAIEAVYGKGFYYSEAVMEIMRSNLLSREKPKPIFDSSEALSKREIEVLELICQQFTNKEIAEKLFISDRTVAGHRNNILDKTGARNTAGMVIYAISKGFYRPDQNLPEQLN